MRENNSIWNNVPYNWSLRGGTIVPLPNNIKFLKL